MPTVVQTSISNMTDWANAVAALPASLIVADEIHIFNIQAVVLNPVAEMFLDGDAALTDYNHYVWVRGVSPYHNGVANDVSGTGNSRIDGGGYVGHTIRSSLDAFRISDIEILDGGGTGAGAAIKQEQRAGAGLEIGDIRIARCVLHNTGLNTNAANYGIEIINALAGHFRVRIHNNVIYGFGGHGIRTDDSISEASSQPDGDYSMIVNNTVAYCWKVGTTTTVSGNIRLGSTAGTFQVLCENNMSFNPGGSQRCYFYGNANPFTGSRNISSDATGSSGYTSQSISDYLTDSTDPASAGGFNATTKTTAVLAADDGRYYGDPMTMDIRRQGRTIPWSIGAFEVAGYTTDMDADYEYPFDFDIADHPIRTNVKGWNEVRRTLSDIAGLGAAIAQEFMMGSQTFTPSWTAVTSNPSVVSGRLTGRYVAIGKRIMVTYHLYLDGDDNLGSGAWRFSLPFPPQAGMHYFGTGIVIHPSTSSGGHSPSICRSWIPDGQTTVRLFGQLDTAEWGPTVPHAWNGGDTLNFTIEYSLD